MIADGGIFGERKIQSPYRPERLDKKTPPGGERFRGGANKGTGILEMETVLPRQLVNFFSNYYASK